MPSLIDIRRRIRTVKNREIDTTVLEPRFELGSLSFSDRELNEIIWRSVKGPQSAMPPAVRSGFIRKAAADADDDDRR